MFSALTESLVKCPIAFSVGYNGSSSKASSSSMPITPRSEGEILQSCNLNSISFSELKNATRNFRPDSVLGDGGFGSVFKGWIDESTLIATKAGSGMVIAVKRLNQDGFQGHKEWLVSGIYLLFIFISFYGMNYVHFILLVSCKIRRNLHCNIV